MAAGLIFAGLALLTVAGLYSVYSIQAAASLSSIKRDEVWRAGVGASWQTLEIRNLSRDLRFLIGSSALKRWLSNGDARARSELEADFLALGAANPFYNQLRILDVTGNEVIRIERNDGKLTRAPPGELQDKSDRYYFVETMKLREGEVFVSPLDLNVENGIIETPIRPMLRLATTVFDAAGGKQGIVILNYSAESLLTRLRHLALSSKGEPWLLNNVGYWLMGPEGAEWAFMYSRPSKPSFAKAHAEAWQEISAGPAANQFLKNGDLYSYAKVVLPANTSARLTGDPAVWSWVYLTYVSATTLAELKSAAARPLLIVGAFLLPLFAFIAIIGVNQHARRKAAEELRDEAELRAQGERLANLIIESSPSAFVVIDSNGRIVQVNAAVERMFGYPRNDLIGEMAEMLLPERLRDPDGLIDDYYSIPEKRGFKLGHGSDRVGLRKDGGEFTIEVGLGKMQIGDVRLLIASVADVSEQRALQRENENERKEIRRLNAGLEQRVAARTAELQATNRELEAFCYSVSHDLRAPLRIIDGFSQMLETDYADKFDKAGQDNVARIRRSAQRMGELIDDLLNLSRIARNELTRVTCDLSALAREVSDTLRVGAPERQVEFKVADGITAHGDVRLLMIALENLVSNAWKFSADRSPARIEFGKKKIDGSTAYYVRDNGVGFDMAYAGKLFGAFQRLHNSAEFSGHGIGLATVQRIIVKHVGRIWAEAEPERGAAFYFTLGPDRVD